MKIKFLAIFCAVLIMLGGCEDTKQKENSGVVGDNSETVETSGEDTGIIENNQEEPVVDDKEQDMSVEESEEIGSFSKLSDEEIITLVTPFLQAFESCFYDYEFCTEPVGEYGKYKMFYDESWNLIKIEKVDGVITGDWREHKSYIDGVEQEYYVDEINYVRPSSRFDSLDELNEYLSSCFAEKLYEHIIYQYETFELLKEYDGELYRAYYPKGYPRDQLYYDSTEVVIADDQKIVVSIDNYLDGNEKGSYQYTLAFELRMDEGKLKIHNVDWYEKS